ncbi:hypothetical protein M3592_25855 [Priestia aryabhattai]|uniref:hypothetical protein n=1 Tax=Priestia aryabhattai TaxID=412384 RepID=UPI00203C9DDF|nr:hypothetical protein [Priestia aryabhattai]MCM2978869.1 hypothetical protein [Priestia aryabhattai]
MNNEKKAQQNTDNRLDNQNELAVGSFTTKELSYLHNLLMEREKFILNQNGKGMTEEEVDYEGQFLMEVAEKIFTVLTKE